MNDSTNTNHFMSLGRNKSTIEEKARRFWSTTNGAEAEHELSNLLSEGPKPANNTMLTTLALKFHLPLFGKQLNIDYLNVNKTFEVKNAGRVFWCGLAGKEDSYWSSLPSLKLFWGVVEERKEKDRYGALVSTRVVSDAQIENEGHHGEIQIPVSLKKPPSPGVFIVGQIDDSANLWMRPFDDSKSPFMVRVWSDFKEAETGSLAGFLRNNGNEPVSITPKFQTKYSKILIHDNGKLYSGFAFANGAYSAQAVNISIPNFVGKDSFRQSFYILNFVNGVDISYNGDVFMLVNPNSAKWQSHTAFLQDSEFWKEWKSSASSDDKCNGNNDDSNSNNNIRRSGEGSGKNGDKTDTNNASSSSTPVANKQSGSHVLGNQDEEEKEALLNFWNTLNDAGWIYSLRDIIRFHTSVRCEPLTILGGMPGSGKSALAKMYASYFGIDNNSFLRIDVQPSWHDRMDFLGFVKTHGIHLEFVEAETGMASFLGRAKNSPNGLWLACLEEINLARPEHYFADFLQRMSLPDSERQDSPILFYLGEDKSKAVPIVSAVRFVGTCNFDETTQNFSPRFLDRCNYIELQPPSLESAFFPEHGSAPQQVVFDEATRSKWEWSPWTSVERNRTDDNRDIVMQIINGSKICLQDLGILPSPRIVSSIVRYIEARIDAEEEERQNGQVQAGRFANDVFVRAFDEAVAQRILPKLSSAQGAYPAVGIEKKLEELKSHLRLDTQVQSLSIDVIDRYINSFSTKMNP